MAKYSIPLMPSVAGAHAMGRCPLETSPRFLLPVTSQVLTMWSLLARPGFLWAESWTRTLGLLTAGWHTPSEWAIVASAPWALWSVTHILTWVFTRPTNVHTSASVLVSRPADGAPLSAPAPALWGQALATAGAASFQFLPVGTSRVLGWSVFLWLYLSRVHPPLIFLLLCVACSFLDLFFCWETFCWLVFFIIVLVRFSFTLQFALLKYLIQWL